MSLQDHEEPVGELALLDDFRACFVAAFMTEVRDAAQLAPRAIADSGTAFNLAIVSVRLMEKTISDDVLPRSAKTRAAIPSVTAPLLTRPWCEKDFVKL